MQRFRWSVVLFDMNASGDMTMATDDLVKRCLQGDSQALSALYNQYYTWDIALPFSIRFTP